MKRCPECRRDYYDDTLFYCLDDGNELLGGPRSADTTVRSSSNEPATAILSEPPVSAGGQLDEAKTRAFIHTTQAKAEPRESLGGLSERQSLTAHRAAKPRTRKNILAAVVGLAALILIGGFIGYKYFAPAKQIESIAVMPFVNESGDADTEYLSDGITESLINNLSQLSELSVKGRSSVFRYKGRDIEPQQVAADLKVQAVLNGRLSQRGDSVTISLDLVDGVTGNQLWGEQYTRKAVDLAALQSEIARDVSQKLRNRLTGAEQNRVVKNQTQNTEAYQLYLHGRYNWNKRTPQGTKKAVEYFQQAIAKDPTYAMAYVGLAESYLLSGDLSADERYTMLKAAALKALELDPTLGEPHAVLAAYLINYQFDPAGGEKEIRRAIELSPNYATAYHWRGESLVNYGRFDEGLAAYKKALELDPLSLAIGTDYGIALFYARQYDQSIDYLKKLIEMEPSYVRTHHYLARVYLVTGRFEEALDEFEKGSVLEGGNPDEIAQGKQAVADALKLSGTKGLLNKILEFMEKDVKAGKPVDASQIALFYSLVGDRDEAFKWLDKAVQERSGAIYTLKVSPEWDNIRDDPRFTALLRQVRLAGQ